MNDSVKIRPRVLLATYYNFPCKEQIIENIFAKELGKKYDISIILKGKAINKKYKMA